MTTLRFRAQIEINKINPYVLVDARRAARLQKNWRKPMPVCIQVNGKPDQPWRINMMPIGDGSFYLYLHGTVRKAAGAQVGDVVRVVVRFDEDYSGGPAHPMPSRFGAELKRNQRARHNWDALSPSRQKEILRYIAALKSPEARQRNVKRALHVLTGGKARFMGRDWNESGKTLRRPVRAQTNGMSRQRKGSSPQGSPRRRSRV
jgi:bacteriocin resistance YdeI/OmpD-like protein/uncharacterized protein DUF1905